MSKPVTVGLPSELNEWLNQIKAKRVEATGKNTTLGKLIMEACYSYYKDGANVVPSGTLAPSKEIDIEELPEDIPDKPLPGIQSMLNELETIGNRILEIAR